MTSQRVRVQRDNDLDPDHRLAVCLSKDGFATASMALRIAKRMIRRNKQHRGISVYRCGHCRQFHIGGSAD